MYESFAKLICAEAKSGNTRAAQLVLEIFCNLHNEEKPIPPPILDYLSECFDDLLCDANPANALHLGQLSKGRPRAGTLQQTKVRVRKESLQLLQCIFSTQTEPPESR